SSTRAVPGSVVRVSSRRPGPGSGRPGRCSARSCCTLLTGEMEKGLVEGRPAQAEVLDLKAQAAYLRGDGGECADRVGHGGGDRVVGLRDHWLGAGYRCEQVGEGPQGLLVGGDDLESFVADLLLEAGRGVLDEVLAVVDHRDPVAEPVRLVE